MKQRVGSALAVLGLMGATGPLSAGCGSDGQAGGASGSGGTAAAGGSGGTAAAGGSAGAGGGGGGGGGGGPVTGCLPAEGPGASDTDTWNDGDDTATVVIDDPSSCQRSYQLSTTADLLVDSPDSPRTLGEQADQPVVRTGHDMFDALYALAIEEVRQCSVDAIQDGAFNGGQPISCPPGGCFETGQRWTYVWTRDTAYAVKLGLAALDPTRARNSLEFKTSERRGGGGRQIVQDTGTGGSYPISTDRVVWAMGAWELLKYLEGTERSAFRDLAYEAISNTAEHDRQVIYDPADGLYPGEQSFLDWREQSYPGWTATDTVQIGMSKALSTNIGHYHMLTVAAQLASEKGLSSECDKYQGWADDLRQAIGQHFYLASDQLFSTFSTTYLDSAPTHQYDLLSSAFAVLFGIADGSQATEVLSHYPHLPKGAPVIWPQQQDIPIYHYRAIWPFATAFWLKAAGQAEQAAAIDHAVRSLMRGAALYLSNMENFEVVTGAAWLDEGATSGPVVNSPRQLWSVAGYVSMVHDVVFGLEANQDGIRFLPSITRELRQTLFAGADSIALSSFPYKGRKLFVRVHLDELGNAQPGVLAVDGVRLNGTEVGTDFIAASSLSDGDLIEVTLAPGSGSAGSLVELDAGDIADYRNLFGPHTPSITNIGLDSDRVRIEIDNGGETPSDIELAVYRDGALVASGLAGSTASWTDPDSADHQSHSYCYSVEASFAGSGNRSQHAQPVCYWGESYERIYNMAVGADVSDGFTPNGGQRTYQYGRWHFSNWGAADHSLSYAGFSPSQSGQHLVQLLAGNGAGGFDTGVTCGVKRVTVEEQGVSVVASGYLKMPHLGTWDDWRGSSFLPVTLDSSKSYTITIDEDEHAVNMSELEHFALYGGAGGASRHNYVNIAELKLLAVEMQ